MCATEEQLAMVATAGIDHVSYLLGIYSLAFILYLCKCFYPQSLSTRANN